MIYLYSHENLRLWNRGEHQVRLDVPNNSRPMGYCDGTDEDERELRQIAESEGVEHFPIEKRLLKTGRQIWMCGALPTETDLDE